jgi:phosphate/sulfate permease
MDITTVYMLIGFLLAAYSVIGNDSVQTLGTFIASNENVKWYWLWIAASSMLIITLTYAWMTTGDISFGRLNQIPWQEVQWYHAAAPVVLLILTRFGIPVSTTFLVLSVFASGVVLEKMLVKSFVGYGLAACTAYGLWWLLGHVLDENKKLTEHHKQYWDIAMWISSGWLWYAWLSHDMANIAVFLPRELSFIQLVGVELTCVALLAYIFYTGGGKIHEIVVEKHGTRFARSSTIINIIYASILIFFKEYNDLPMSTTWVFVGMLAGRELAVNRFTARYKEAVFPLIQKDFIKMMIGLGASVAIVLAIQSL